MALEKTTCSPDRSRYALLATIDIGIQLHRVVKMLTSAGLADLDEHAQRFEQHDLTAWDSVLAEHGLRGPDGLGLANPPRGHNPRPALEPVS
jgi:hypothetical protein